MVYIDSAVIKGADVPIANYKLRYRSVSDLNLIMFRDLKMANGDLHFRIVLEFLYLE